VVSAGGGNAGTACVAVASSFFLSSLFSSFFAGVVVDGAVAGGVVDAGGVVAGGVVCASASDDAIMNASTSQQRNIGPSEGAAGYTAFTGAPSGSRLCAAALRSRNVPAHRTARRSRCAARRGRRRS